MTTDKAAPLDWLTARDAITTLLTSAGYSVIPPPDEFAQRVAFIAQAPPQLAERGVRWGRISTTRAGGIWKARTILEALIQPALTHHRNQYGLGPDDEAPHLWFEVWSVHSAHEPAARDAGGQGCPYGLGRTDDTHFLVRRFKPARTSQKWEPVEVWPVEVTP